MRYIMSKIAKSELCHTMVARLVQFYIKFVYYTSRWQVINPAIPQNFIDQHKPFIACFWHGRLAMIPQMWQWRSPMTALVSAHQDGILVGRVFKLFGVECIMGSTNRGGAQALLQVIRALKKGHAIGMTPDGPRGPREVVNPGIILMAKAGKATIVPVSYAVKRYKTLKTWDRFMLPLPFNRGVFLWGEPITVPHDANDLAMEDYRQQLQSALTFMQEQADYLVHN